MELKLRCDCKVQPQTRGKKGSSAAQLGRAVKMNGRSHTGDRDEGQEAGKGTKADRKRVGSSIIPWLQGWSSGSSLNRLVVGATRAGAALTRAIAWPGARAAAWQEEWLVQHSELGELQ